MAMYRLLIAAAILLVPSAASAQRQPTSCSTGAQACKEGISRASAAKKLDSSSCDKAFLKRSTRTTRRSTIHLRRESVASQERRFSCVLGDCNADRRHFPVQPSLLFG
jgi:hypothetical protein